MSFSAIASHMPRDEIGWGQWHLAHAREHREFTDALLGQTPPVPSIEFPIERQGNVGDWLIAHQEMSQSVWSGAGGGQSQDFRTVDWTKDEEVNVWLLDHAKWHAQMRDALGL